MRTAPKYRSKYIHNRAAGQAAFEFAMAVPFLMLVIVCVLYFGRYFLITQVLLHAAQEGARVAAAMPINSSDPNSFPTTMNLVRGFASPQGGNPNPNSAIYGALASANLLSQGSTGDLPSGAMVEVLPWDDASQQLPAGTVAVKIIYPFQFLNGPFGTGAMDTPVLALPAYQTNPLLFYNFPITQMAVAARSVYQN